MSGGRGRRESPGRCRTNWTTQGWRRRCTRQRRRRWVARPEPDWARVHRELARHKGVTLQLLWLEYREAHPDGYQYSRFCDRYREWRGRLDVVLRQVYRAGEKAYPTRDSVELIRICRTRRPAECARARSRQPLRGRRPLTVRRLPLGMRRHGGRGATAPTRELHRSAGLLGFGGAEVACQPRGYTKGRLA